METFTQTLSHQSVPRFWMTKAGAGLLLQHLREQDVRATLHSDARWQQRTGKNIWVDIPGVSTAGMAYPINWIKTIVGDMVADKQVHKGWLGIVGYHDGHNTRIREIKADSPAQAAGLQPGDVIVSFNRQEVKSVMELARLVRYSSPGQEVVLGYLRDGATAETSVSMGEKMSTSVPVFESPPDDPMPPEQLVSETSDQREMLELRIQMLENEVRKLRKLIEIK